MMRILFMLLVVMLTGVSVLLVPGKSSAASAEARTVIAETEVTKWGQMPVRFVISGQRLPEGIEASQFTISGQAAGWGTNALHPFTCGVADAVSTEDGWELIPEAFPEKYFYVREMTVACDAAPELGFTLGDITQTLAGTADRFTLWEADDAPVKAQIFRPETIEPVPVVVVFHGYGDTANLLTYRTAVDWAEPAHQAVRPCVVIAPVIEDGLYVSDIARSKVFDRILSLIDEMAAEGLADPERIYLMGNSFGGMSSIEMAERYPDRITAVMALCPALNYSRTGMAQLAKITGIPVYIAQAENDETIPSSVGRQAAETLEAAGGQVILRIYSDAEMEAAGAVHGSEQTYSFHHVELALLEDEAYAEWLFAQHR